MYNDFCKQCVGGKTQDHIDEIKECEDRKCPFFEYRRTLLDWQIRRKELKRRLFIQERMKEYRSIL